jgi:extracellular matrix regulatory protein A
MNKGERYLHLGFDNTVAFSRVVAILMPEGNPMKRLRERAEQEGRMLDATHGRRMRALVITDSNHMILSSNRPETLWQRLGGVEEDGK